jgi:hypothetical protein
MIVDPKVERAPKLLRSERAIEQRSSDPPSVDPVTAPEPGLSQRKRPTVRWRNLDRLQVASDSLPPLIPLPPNVPAKTTISPKNLKATSKSPLALANSSNAAQTLSPSPTPLLRSPVPSTSRALETGISDAKEPYSQFHDSLRPAVKVFKLYYRQNKLGAAPHPRKAGPLTVRYHPQF